MARAVYKEHETRFRLIQKMAVEQTTSKILVEIETFLFYRKSRVGIIAGKLLKPIFSRGCEFAREGEPCNIKFKLDLIDFSRMPDVKIVEVIISNTCEEKAFKGNIVKQFTAKSIPDYISDRRKTVTF